MRYAVLAVDYDGTIATHGVVDNATLDALETVKKSGRALVLVTGRDLDDLIRVFPRTDLFDRIVAENGALVYNPRDQQVTTLGEPPPPAFVEALQARGVQPLSVGRVIVATWEPNEIVVLETIRLLGLELQVIFNKGAVMVLPAGINKATGLERALGELGMSPHNAVGVGDAENDHAFLNLCEYAVAVSNALPGLKERADWITNAPRGAGVAEIVTRLVESDLEAATSPTRRHHVPIGTAADGTRVTINPHGTRVLIAGPSGSGKSTVATAVLEHLTRCTYQICLIDPEGDYATFERAIVLGDHKTPPTVNELLDVLRKPPASVVAVLLGVGLDGRPAFFDAAMTGIQGLFAQAGRPHWLVLDEAHHLLSPSAGTARSLPEGLDSSILITVHPDQIPPAVLASVNLLIAVGPDPSAVVSAFTSGIGVAMPPLPAASSEGTDAVAWFRGEAAAPIRFRPDPPHGERLRHRRKYAEGTLGPDKSFYFRGPLQKLQLRAQNFGVFLQLAEGVDDETWLYHLERADYSSWVRDAIKDDELADEIAGIESAHKASAPESRAAIAEAIGRRYTLPSHS